jgi:tripartite-type tricarboxylate transporter receptor subunit TctC
VLLAPVGTPDAIIQKASADLRKAMDDAELKKKLAALGAYVVAMSPAEVTKFAQDQQKTWQPVAQKVANEMAQPPK